MIRQKRFSVIIPTLQKARQLSELVDTYAAHRRVGEILIINNSPTPLPIDHPKVRILDQEANIFVNPAWNLGAREAREDLLLISNDDIMIKAGLVDALARVLALPVGVVGPHPSAFDEPKGTGRVWFSPARHRSHGFGTLMAMRKESYRPIPEALLITCGDDWLFGQQTRPNLTFRGAPVTTEMSVTSGRSEFTQLAARDTLTFKSRYIDHVPYYESFQRGRRALRMVRGLIGRGPSDLHH